MPNRTSFGWARGVSDGYARSRHLTNEGWEGFAWAQELAQASYDRGQDALRGIERQPLTVEDVASLACVSPTTVRRRIATAKTQLFGSLGTSGIYYRLEAFERRKSRRFRKCEAPGCDRYLPEASTPRRKYCNPRCKARAHRARSSSTTNGSRGDPSSFTSGGLGC
jgi:hypothetical protein